MALAAMLLSGRYVLDELIGSGGYCEVWRATDGVIHRDIKPANILLAPGGAVRITDFGIAHAVGSAPVTSTGMVMGTPGYIAPERVAGAAAGRPSDLYALGIMAYECLAGAPPFSGGALEVAIAHRDRPLPPLPASVPAAVAAFVMLLAAKDPARRPGSAGEVALQASRLRNALLSDGDGASPTLVAAPTEAPLTIANDSVRQTPGDPLSRPRTRRPRHRRALAATALAFAALACLVPLSVAGFAPASHRHHLRPDPHAAP
jgi:eukaryotic-like serine/threonine-protein kinase